MFFDENWCCLLKKEVKFSNLDCRRYQFCKYKYKKLRGKYDEKN